MVDILLFPALVLVMVPVAVGPCLDLVDSSSLFPAKQADCYIVTGANKLHGTSHRIASGQNHCQQGQQRFIWLHFAAVLSGQGSTSQIEVLLQGKDKINNIQVMHLDVIKDKQFIRLLLPLAPITKKTSPSCWVSFSPMKSLSMDLFYIPISIHQMHMDVNNGTRMPGIFTTLAIHPTCHNQLSLFDLYQYPWWSCIPCPPLLTFIWEENLLLTPWHWLSNKSALWHKLTINQSLMYKLSNQPEEHFFLLYGDDGLKKQQQQ